MDASEILKEKIKALEEQCQPLRERLERLESKKLEQYKKSLIGECFVFRKNSYSCPVKPSDYWDVYYKVVRLGEYGVIAIMAECDSNKEVTIKETQLTVWSPDRTPNDLEWISEETFNTNYDALLKKIKLERKKE